MSEATGMSMDRFYEVIEHAGYIPMTGSERVQDPARLAHALATGGAGVVVVECVGDSAATVIHDMIAAEPGLLVGAGAVASSETLKDVAHAGAGFVVLPSYDEALCHECIESGMPCIPTTVDEGGIFKADRMGLKVTGIVTANDRDAISVIDTFADAFTGHRFMPVGRVDETNVETFLADPAVIACCSQDWVTRPEFVEGGEYEGIGRLAAEANALVRRSRR
ncbi:MAG: hypothetical protein LKI25_07535 [Atopobiaceae bacterium]|jgi:2-dehydro-3-deoxyphosphogluconate aldolase/(4S)-4-hydroxy-2-oxoglutarate aldolase|nr:hypothetical protein [Atopobiaceae bacterium]MCI2174039.1 hypothetical protein [Atopobiaceae bacterium]MCI2207871.1 hypothetical protein [Atopobiaceae bacterium]